MMQMFDPLLQARCLGPPHLLPKVLFYFSKLLQPACDACLTRVMSLLHQSCCVLHRLTRYWARQHPPSSLGRSGAWRLLTVTFCKWMQFVLTTLAASSW